MSKESQEEADDNEEVGDKKLDSCMIHVEPQLKTDIEHLLYPVNLLTQLDMEAYESDKGLVLVGE